MKKNLILIFLCTPFLLFASTPLDDVLSEVIAPLASSKKKATWVNFQHTIGSETFSLLFPKEPTQLKKDKHFIVYAESEDPNVLYELCVATPPVVVADREEFFDHYLQTWNQGKLMVESYEIFEKGNQSIMDVVINSLKYDIEIQVRVVITPNNYYLLMSCFYKDSKNQHEDFVDSFLVTQTSVQPLIQ